MTVITATYNWASVLPYSIGSALDQTFSDFELLVIGDGCTDDSEAVVAAIADPRVRWHNLSANTGHQTGPNNEGLRQARGDAIAYLGHDDLWLPCHLELLVQALDEGAKFVHATTLLVFPDRRPIPEPRGRWRYQPGEWLAPTSVAHDRAVVDVVGGWRAPQHTGTLEPEGELWQRMEQHCGAPRWLPRITSIKLPAGLRRDVYKARPCHEQAYWLQRIRDAPDPEASLRAACHEQYVLSKWSRSRNRLELVRSKIAVRVRLRRLGLLPPARTASKTAAERLRQRRRFNGLDD